MSSHRPVLRPRLRAPAGYPSEYERDLALADGRGVHLRPIVPEDEDELRTAVAEADPATVHSRFIGGRPPTTDDEFARLVRVDYHRRFAVVALSHSRRGVGIARYEAAPGETCAEIAVAVDPGWRQAGLATAMLHLLAEAALANGIDRFAVEYLADNVDVTAILRASKLPVDLRQQNGVAQAEIDLTANERELGLAQPPSLR